MSTVAVIRGDGRPEAVAVCRVDGVQAGHVDRVGTGRVVGAVKAEGCHCRAVGRRRCVRGSRCEAGRRKQGRAVLGVLLEARRSILEGERHGRGLGEEGRQAG